MAHRDDTDTQRANVAFIRSSMRARMLERDHELALARRWRETGDQTALHALITAYTRLVVSAASRFRHYGLPLGDLIQEGNLGLMQAAQRFEPAREVRFSTYATWWIRSQIQDYILRNWSIVRTGTTVSQKALFFQLRRLRARLGTGPDGLLTGAGAERIAALLQVTPEDVRRMERRLGGPDQSLNGTVGESGETELQDLMADTRPNPEESTFAHHDRRRLLALLADALAELDPRERRIIARRRLREEGDTLEALGAVLGVSKERVRQIEQRALDKLRQSLERRQASPLDLPGPA